MGLFRSKKGSAASTVDGSGGSTTQKDGNGNDNKNKNNNGKQRKRKLFSLRKKSKTPPRQQSSVDDSATQPPTPAREDPQQRQQQQQQQRRDNRNAEETSTLEEDSNIGDVPRSISTPSREGADCDASSFRCNSGDSLGSPCEAMTNAALHAAIQPPSMERLPQYVAALSASISPDPSADLSSRALRCLFSLTEHSSQKQHRIDMVRWAGDDDLDEDPHTRSLVPALLSFLKRCPRDSSEQYLTLLVLNNLSIPTQNKRLIGLDHGGAHALGRLLCEDPGCHLLVIIVVNLTFGDETLNRDLLTMSGDVQLVDSLSYALLLASLTTEQLSALGPIPLTSPEGTPHAPRKLLSLLFTLLETNLGIRYRRDGHGNAHGDQNALPPLSLASDEYPFPETARWCLGALKNLTRPSRLSPSSGLSSADLPLPWVSPGQPSDASAVAAHAVLDAGVLPLLLRVLRHDGSAPDGAARYAWQSNTAQDAALYALMHVASVPQARGAMAEDKRGCVQALASVLNYGKVASQRLMDAAKGDGEGPEDAELGRTRLQCLKARLTLSYLLLGPDASSNGPSQYGSVTILGEHETHALIDVLSHCLQGSAKEGHGSYSAATFSLKGVLRAVEYILSEPKNGALFASSGAGARLNALLLKVVARHALTSDDETTRATIDAEAAEHAAVCVQRMTPHGLDGAAVGFEVLPGRGAFLPEAFGDHGAEARGVATKVFQAYLETDGIARRGRHAASQVLFRLPYLRCEGSVADMAYPGKYLPSKSDFDMDHELLAAIDTVSDEYQRTGGTVPSEYIFDRLVSRNAKEGTASKVPPRIFPSALAAAEELAAERPYELIDTVEYANNIAYYADGLDVFHGHVWKWHDGKGDLIERIYSADATEDQMLVSGEPNDSTERSEPYSPPRKGLLGRFKMAASVTDDNEPFSIFGFKCGAPCGNRVY